MGGGYFVAFPLIDGDWFDGGLYIRGCMCGTASNVMKAGKYAHQYFLCHATVVATVLKLFSRSRGELQSKKIVAADKLTLIR